MRIPRKSIRVIIILCFLIEGFVFVKRMPSEKQNTLRLGYSFFGSIQEIDPAHILSIYQSNIIENLYSRLIDYDNAGQIVCGLCSAFKVDQDTIHFFFKNPSQTTDGYVIDSASAKASLDRIMRSETNTHGTLKYYLDSSNNNPINASEGQLSIKVAKAQWTHFVLNLLASMDFSIVPKESLDLTGKKIIDYRNTSGFYYVEHSDDKGNLLLKVNPNHMHYKSTMPHQIQFVPILSGKAADSFIKNEIDMIDPTYYSYKEDIDKILKNLPQARVHKTFNIGLTSVVFTSHAMTSSSIEDRLAAALLVRDIFLSKTPSVFGAEDTDQYFQSFGQGFITDEQHQVLKSRLNHPPRISGYKFTLGVTEKYRQWLSQSDFPDFIYLKFFKQYPGFLPDAEKPDIYILTGDSSFDEDISALSYLFSQGTFSLRKEDGAKWIQNYMDIPSKEARIRRLQELHYEMLYSVKVFPIVSRPYIAITNAKWDLDFPKIYAGSPLWRVWAR